MATYQTLSITRTTQVQRLETPGAEAELYIEVGRKLYKRIGNDNTSIANTYDVPYDRGFTVDTVRLRTVFVLIRAVCLYGHV